MNRLQFLLTKLAEESSEIAQAALKAQQFGLHADFQGKTNLEALRFEFNDLLTICKMLNNEFETQLRPDREYIDLKESKVDKYYDMSQTLGFVELDEMVRLSHLEQTVDKLDVAVTHKIKGAGNGQG